MAQEKGILSKGITLAYSATENGEYKVLRNLQEIPELGGDTESVETTTLDDAAHMYINGLISYGDSVNFTFLYDKAQFAELAALEGTNWWKVSLPDGEGAAGSTCVFSGEAHVKMNATGTNVAITYTLAVKPQSEMVFA